MMRVIVLLCHLSQPGVETCHEVVAANNVDMQACMLDEAALARWKSLSQYSSDDWRIARWKCADPSYVLKGAI